MLRSSCCGSANSLESTVKGVRVFLEDSGLDLGLVAVPEQMQ